MNVLVSGVHAKLGASFFESVTGDAPAFQWAPVGQFTDQITALDADARFKQAIWLYRPPWSMGFLKELTAAGKDVAGFLEAWEHDNRLALSARGLAQVPLIYVNADRTTPQHVLQPPTNGDTNDASPSSRIDVLGMIASFAEPRLWDVLETLEAVAYNPSGALPLFRNMCRADAASLRKAMQWAIDAQDAGRLRDETDRLRHDLGLRAAELSAEREQHADARKESELLRSQLQKTREESGGLRNETDRLRHDLGQRSTELDSERTRHAHARKERELLLAQLHQVQEELEQYYLRYEQAQKDLDTLRKTAADAGKEVAEFQSESADARKEKLRQTLVEPGASLVPATEEIPAHTGVVPLRLLRRAISRTMVRRQQKALRDRIRRSDWFDVDWYVQTYPDVREAQIDPVQHYLSVGWRENRNPGPKFDTAFYLKSNPDVRKHGSNPLVHFLEHGTREGRRPRPA